MEEKLFPNNNAPGLGHLNEFFIVKDALDQYYLHILRMKCGGKKKKKPRRERERDSLMSKFYPTLAKNADKIDRE